MTFDYFYVLSHARSPFPKAIFKYDKKSGKYLPANRLFPDEVAQNLTKDLAEVVRRGRNFFQTLQISTPHEDVRASVLRRIGQGPRRLRTRLGKGVKVSRDCEKHNPSE
jgi:hypothetical protein